MSDQSYTTTFSVDRTPQEVFDAVTNVRGWWSESIDGDTDRVGAEFSYQYEDVHRCRIQVTELVPGRKVSWLVLDNYFSFTQDKTEWKDTTIDFEITGQAGGAELRFTHVGLVPQYECYDACSEGWGNYINGSLRNLITTGEGQPNGENRARTSAEQRLGSAQSR